MDLIEKVKSTNLIEYGDKVVVGVSGGPDSVCLLSLLKKLSEELNLTLFVCHINHSLREEADSEEEFVRKFCEEQDIEFYSKKVDINKMVEEEKKSTEEVAREVRYNFFYEILEKVNGNKIAIAHNLNDNAETLLMNLIRGAGLDGLCGIKKENKEIIRPLLLVTREEIEEYIKENNLVTMIDKTNFETIYTRNKIRNELIPYLKNINPDIIYTLKRTSDILNENREIIKKTVENYYYEIRLFDNVIDKNKFLKLENSLKREVLRFSIYKFLGNLVDISMKTVDNALSIIETSTSGSIIKISKNVKIRIEYDKMIFFNEEENIDFLYELNIPGTTYITEIDKTITAKIVDANDVPDFYSDKNKCFFDIEKTGKKLYVRNRRFGDFFEPSGILGKKSLKKFFADLKIPVSLRNKIPIVASDNDILWVVGYRTSKKFLKDNSTKEVIILEYGENI